MTTAFERYFELHFQTSLRNVGDEAVFSDGRSPISGASWDRRAAYLLWIEIGRPGDEAVKTPGHQSPPPVSAEEDWDIA